MAIRRWAFVVLVVALVALALSPIAVKEFHEYRINQSAAVWDTLEFTRETLAAVPPQVRIRPSKYSPNRKANFSDGAGVGIGSYYYRADPMQVPQRGVVAKPLVPPSNFTVTDLTGKITNVSIAPGIQMSAATWISNANFGSDVTHMATSGDDGVLRNFKLIPRLKPISSRQETRWLETDTNLASAQLIGIGLSIEQILLLADGIQDVDKQPLERTPRVLGSGMPVGRYDFIANLASGSRNALAELVRQQFGYVGTRTDILLPCCVLKFDHTGAPGLKPVSPAGTGDFDALWARRRSFSIDDFINRMGFPGYITNETGLTEKFDIDWTLLPEFPFQHRTAPTPALVAEFQKTILTNFGLQLILTNTVSTEFFQIDHVK